ncbi:uncharacterized protein LOC111333563 isoform X2 [Stylophora pistillata]|uniref:uncharacterized protein LOC111333563 isoform X2 n=1 Tax=Stylophora pistillata TaxID=50429 RepID=UPI000C053E1F|nr:uncharacterized protein LOC111333563 isoform X2 [Stylophora pistillata]
MAEDDTNMYSNSGENEGGGERYSTVTLTKKEQFNILYDSRAFMDSYDQFEDDDEIKESENPLYCSSIETGQDENENILYESMDNVIQSVEEAESINPIMV